MPHHKSHNLVTHFFRKEYGKLLALTARYVEFESAEDIVQDTLLTAAEHWKLRGIPPHPEAWLYKTAKNKTLNYLRKRNKERLYHNNNQGLKVEETIEFSEELITDELLRMMLKCCHPSLSVEVTLALILKNLCGFSVAEVAAALLTNAETVNKRMVRGRKKLRSDFRRPVDFQHLNKHLETLLEVIYLLFNEGYLPTHKHQKVRKDICLEAIRLAHVIVNNQHVKNKENAHALLALMYLNCSRFEAREILEEDMVELALQDRTLWNKGLIDKGLHHLELAQRGDHMSKYLILAAISGNHCVAPTFEATNWREILSLYDALLTIDHSPLARLNRIVALSMAGNQSEALAELEKLKQFESNHIFHSVRGHLKSGLGELEEATIDYKKAIDLANNQRDKKFLLKKLNTLVPISNTQV